MKLLVATILFIFTLVACDAPQRTRYPYDVSGSSDNGTSTAGTEQPDPSDQTGSETDNNDDTASSDGFEGCNLSYQHDGKLIGYFGLCQNNDLETRFKVKMANSDSTTGTCFVPIHRESNGNSFKLGIAECVNNEADREYTFTLTKERSEAINGVMVLKANALNAYMQCMSAKIDYINAYSTSLFNCANDLACLQAANNYAYNICSQFQQIYSSYYVQVNL